MPPPIPRLMIPGPTELAPEVLAALAQPAVAHYGEEWLAEHDETIRLLAQVFETETEPVLIVGAGTAGLEAGAGTLLPPGERVAVGVNGAFGERLVGLMETLGFVVVPVPAPWGEGITREHLSRALDGASPVSLVATVHGETSTGVLNPVAELAAEAHARGAMILVDAISSFGGVRLPVDEWGIDLCVGAPQKCLGAVPGVCPLTVSDQAWERMEETVAASPRPGWCLNLLQWRRYVSERAVWEPYPATMPCALVRALRAALRMLLDEGPANHFRRMETLARAFREGVRALGCRTVAHEEWASPTVTAVLLPPGVCGLRARAFLRDEAGCLVGFGAAAYRDRGFRVGHFGAAANWEAHAQLLRGLGRYLMHAGIEVDEEAGVTAAERCRVWKPDLRDT
ncbi:MAG: alanine--glyoxylate aminotransferase family protein [Armatimonadetes bacterium]|nr:alanine--glyoxylate aminotransferase family protein [Armatimonadota bacterium]